VDSVRLAIEKAKDARGPDAETLLAGCVIASDAFFPFADGPQAAIDVGATAVIQPGGSKRDAEVIEACDAAGVAMVFTKRRHFRHCASAPGGTRTRISSVKSRALFPVELRGRCDRSFGQGN
jgi:hypothetical protein